MKHTEYKSANWQLFRRPDKDTPVGALLFYSGHGGNVTYLLLSKLEFPALTEKGQPRDPAWLHGGTLLCVSSTGQVWIDERRAFMDKTAVFPDSAQDEPYAVKIADDLGRIDS